MEKGHKKTDLRNLPTSAAEFIKHVIQKMRYRRKVREEVQAELAGHFEDELKDCAPDEEREQKSRELVGSFGDVKLLAVLLRRAKKRCRPMWRTVVVRTFQTVGVLILCFILYTIWFLSGKPTVRVDYLAQLNQIAQPQISDEDNAWPYYEKALELFVEPSEELKQMPAYGKWKESGYRRFATLTDEEKQAIGQWVRQNDASWQEFAAGSSKLYCRREYTVEDEGNMLLSVVLPHLADLRDLGRVGVWRSRVKMEQGETAEALDDCLAFVRAGSHWQGKGTIIEQLVGLSMVNIGHDEILHIVSTKDIPVADFKQLQQQLSQIYPTGYPLMDIEGERLVFWDIVQHIFTDGGPGGGHLIPSRLSFVADAVDIGLGSDQLVLCTAIGLVHAGRNDTIAKFNEIFDKQSEAAKMTPYERHAGKALHDERIFLASSKYRYSLINIFMPALGRACKYAYRGRALHEATVTVLALKRWRLEKGQYPMSLNELVMAGYLEQVPMDPYSDKRVIYKKTDDSFVLYSLGPDFDDDGGVENPKDSQKRMQEGPGDEVFWPVPKSQAKKKDIYEKHEQAETHRKTIL